MWRITAVYLCLKNLGQESFMDAPCASATCRLCPCAAEKKISGVKRLLGVHSLCKAPSVQTVLVPRMAERPEQSKKVSQLIPKVSPVL